MLGVVEGTVSSADLAALADVRATRVRRLSADAGAGRPLRDARRRVDRQPVPGGAGERGIGGSGLDEDERRGIGCCPGVVAGRAQVIRDPRGASLAPGDILVAERTDPGWILLFPAAAACSSSGAACCHIRRSSPASWGCRRWCRCRGSPPGCDRRPHRGRRRDRRRAPAVARARAVRLTTTATTAPAVATRADFTAIRYAQCWEDADVLVEALAPQPGHTLVSIARPATTRWRC